MLLFSTLFLLIKLKGYAFVPDVSADCPGYFIDTVIRNVTGSLNKSVLTTGSKGNCVFGVPIVNFNLIKGNKTDVLCTQNFSTSADVCDQNFNAQGCRCDGIFGNMFYYTYQFAANKLVQEDGIIQMKPDCLNGSGQYPLVETLCIIKFEAPTTTTTFIPTTPPCTDCPKSDKCPDWCIAVSVCIPVGGGLIIIITVIIVKKKKSKTPGSRPTPPPDGNNRTEVPTINTKAEVGNNWTELTTTTAPGGNNRTELKTTTAPGGNNRTELNAHL